MLQQQTRIAIEEVIIIINALPTYNICVIDNRVIIRFIVVMHALLHNFSPFMLEVKYVNY